MNITFHLAVRQLEKYSPKLVLCDTDNKSFKRIALLGRSLEAPDQDILYIASLETLLKHLRRFSREHYVVCYGRQADFAALKDSLPCNVIYLSKAEDPSEVVNELMEYAHVLFRWGAELERSVAGGESLQRMMDLSEPFFSNPIFIVTRTLRLVAYTKNIPILHPDLMYMTEHGQFPESMMHSIIKNKWLLKTESFETIGFYYPPNHIGCTQITRAYRANPLRLNTICLYGLNSEPTSCDMDLMTFLAEQVFRFSDNAKQHTFLSDAKDICFIVDIIEGRINKNEIESRALYFMKLNFVACYRMYGVFVRNLALSDSYSAYMQNELKALLPYVCVFQYDNILLMLDDRDDRTSEQFKHIEEKLMTFLVSCNAYCSISNAFTDLTGIQDAYRQVTAAAELGVQYDPSGTFYRYEVYCVYHMISCCSRDISMDSLYVPELGNIIKNDAERGSDDLLLLETLLDCERNITAVSKRMHLHRNSVLYRVGKIEKLLGKSLNDPQARLNLMVSMKVLKMKRSVCSPAR
jgi:sugar diacid utilization regulator